MCSGHGREDRAQEHEACLRVHLSRKRLRLHGLAPQKPYGLCGDRDDAHVTAQERDRALEPPNGLRLAACAHSFSWSFNLDATESAVASNRYIVKARGVMNSND